mgnify:CR=1 FL=1
MKNSIKQAPDRKTAIVIAVILAVIAIFGTTMATGGGGAGQNSVSHGHSHD